MGKRSWIPAILIAFLAAVLVLIVIWPREEPTVRIVVAARDLGAGTILQASDLEVREVPKKEAPADAVTDPAQLVGRMLAVIRFRGEPVTPRSLGPTVQLEPHERGIGVRVRADTSVAGILRPGMTVGVIAVVRDQETNSLQAKAMLEGLRVLYVPPEFQARPYQPIEARAVVSTKGNTTTTTATSARAREGTLVLAASILPEPVYYLSQETARALSEGWATITSTGEITATETITDPLIIQQVSLLPPPDVRYVAPVEVLALLNMSGGLMLDLLPPDPIPGITGGIRIEDLTTPSIIQQVEVP